MGGLTRRRGANENLTAYSTPRRSVMPAVIRVIDSIGSECEGACEAVWARAVRGRDRVRSPESEFPLRLPPPPSRSFKQQLSSESELVERVAFLNNSLGSW